MAAHEGGDGTEQRRLLRAAEVAGGLVLHALEGGLEDLQREAMHHMLLLPGSCAFAPVATFRCADMLGLCPAV